MNQNEKAIQIRRNYFVEIFASITALLLVFLFTIFFLYSSVRINKRLVFNDTFFTLFVLSLCFGFTALFLIQSIVESIIEKRLYQTTKDKEIIFTNDSLRISIGLLVDKEILKQMRQGDQSYFDIKYDEILEVEFCDSIIRSNTGDSPPYYKLTVKNRVKPIFIIRGSTYFRTNDDNDNHFRALIKEKTSANIPSQESAEKMRKFADSMYFVVAVIFFILFLYIFKL